MTVRHALEGSTPQPVRGDVVMHCGHLHAGKMHLFQYDHPVAFTRLDRSRGTAAWFAACVACVVEHGEQAARFVRGDGVWTGDGPAIECEEN